MMYALLLSLLLAPSTRPAAEPIDVWLDVDTSTGVVTNGRNHDVDDGLFMIYAFHSPELNVRGVSVQFGNASLEQAMPIAEEVIDRFGPEGMVAHAGAASADDLDKETDATRALAEALREKPMHVLPVGPVTNVAAVLKQHPELAERMQSIIVVAARRPGFRFGPEQAPGVFFPDANFEKDVEGMRVLIDSGVPIVFAGYEVSSDVWITPADLDAMATKSEAGAWIAETSRPWQKQWTSNMPVPGFNPFDTLALLYLTHPELIESIPVTTEIVEQIDERATPEQQAAGKTKPYLIATPTDEPSRLVYLTEPADEADAIIVDRLAADAR